VLFLNKHLSALLQTEAKQMNYFVIKSFWQMK